MAETGSAALDFNKKISILFKNDPTKVLGIQKCLSDYNENNILFSLVETLRSFISSPNELLLFDYVKPLVLISHQILYEDMRPNGGSILQIRRVILRRKADNSFGFQVRGGEEFNAPIFVSHVDLNQSNRNWATKQSNLLHPGDMIVSVNEFNCSKMRLIDFYNFCQLHQVLSLQIMNYSMLPYEFRNSDNGDRKSLNWDFTEGQSGSSPFKNCSIYNTVVYLKKGFGCSLFSHRESRAIFTQNVLPFSVAHEVGIRDGDQILFVNDVKFFGLSRTEAVMAFHRRSPVSIYFKQKSDTKPKKPEFISLPECPKSILENLEISNAKFLSLIQNSGFKQWDLFERQLSDVSMISGLEMPLDFEIPDEGVIRISSPDTATDSGISEPKRVTTNSDQGQTSSSNVGFESMFKIETQPARNFAIKDEIGPNNSKIQRANKVVDRNYKPKKEAPKSPTQKDSQATPAVNDRRDEVGTSKTSAIQMNGHHQLEKELKSPTPSPKKVLKSSELRMPPINSDISQNDDDNLNESAAAPLKSLNKSSFYREQKRKAPVLPIRSSSFVEPTQVAIENRETSGFRKVTVLFDGYFGLVLDGGRTSSASAKRIEGGFVSSVIVKDIYPESPLKTSVSIGDRIVSIDGNHIANKHLSEVHALLTRIERNKKKGSSVELIVESRGKINEQKKIVENHLRQIQFNSQVTAF